jgi:MFS transporter, putative metabolite:H+ symporter
MHAVVEGGWTVKRRTAALVAGTVVVVLSVVIDVVDFVQMRASGMSMTGPAGMDAAMWLGMLLALSGLAAAVWGLDMPSMLTARTDTSRTWRVHSLDTGPLTPRHVGLAAILVVAMIIDVMKPATLAFVAPGAAAEYHLSPAFVALWWPLCALTGTVVGSLFWGRLADRCGRRSSLYLATLFFAGTAMCGTMPSFGWNLVICFLMGMSAGGMLPLIFTLMAEVLPTVHRGWLSVLVGGAGTVGGYLAASGAAVLLEPDFGWRALWLIGLPTGLFLILLIRYIPESPRHLVLHGRVAEAKIVLERFQARLEEGAPDDAGQTAGHLRNLTRRPHSERLMGLSLYALGWGLVNFGFVTWLPTILRGIGLSGAQANLLLSRSALIAVTGVALMVWFYAKWRTNLVLAVGALGIAVALFAIGLIDPRAGIPASLLVAALGLLLAMLGGSNAVLAVYSAEVFPTSLRATGAGLIAGSSKFGGVLGPPMMAAIFSLSPGLLGPAWALAVPLAAAGLVLWSNAPQTGGLPLEEISR